MSTIQQDEYNLYWHSTIITFEPKKTQSEVNIKNKMRPVDVKALPIIAFALTGRIVLLRFILCYSFTY